MEADLLIAEVARVTGLRLDRTDPVLAVAVINEVLLDQALVKLDRQVKAEADRVTAASTQAVVDAKKEAETLVTKAGEWSEKRLMDAAATAARLVLAELRQETQKMEAMKRVMVGAAWTMAVIGLVVLAGLGGIVLAALR